MGWNLKKKWKKSKIRKIGKKIVDVHKLAFDPMGLVTTADGTAGDIQLQLDVLGMGARPKAQAEAVETAAKAQQASNDKQNALIEEEKNKQEKVLDERRRRMGQNQLLSGRESGRSSLLGTR